MRTRWEAKGVTCKLLLLAAQARHSTIWSEAKSTICKINLENIGKQHLRIVYYLHLFLLYDLFLIRCSFETATKIRNPSCFSCQMFCKQNISWLSWHNSFKVRNQRMYPQRKQPDSSNDFFLKISEASNASCSDATFWNFARSSFCSSCEAPGGFLLKDFDISKVSFLQGPKTQLNIQNMHQSMPCWHRDLVI